MNTCGCSIWHGPAFGPCACRCHLPERDGLTDDERADLAVIAARKAAGGYSDDTLPMRSVFGWTVGGLRVEHVTPWRIAMEAE